MRNHASTIEITRAHLFAGRQHGDNNVGAVAGVRNRCRGFCAGGRQFFDGRRLDIKSLYGMPGFDKVLRHGQAHVTESDESDDCHDVLPGRNLEIIAASYCGCSFADLTARNR